MTIGDSIRKLDDTTLLNTLLLMAARDREGLAEFLLHLMEVDRRRLYAERYSSLFAYVTGDLKYSESCAGKRIQVARLARRFPAVIAAVASGAQHLSGLCLLAPHLREDNVAALLEATAGKSMREIEKIVAHHHPRPDVKDHIRCLPAPTLPPVPPIFPQEFTAKPSPQTIVPLAPTRVQFRFTGRDTLREKLERATALLSHQHPEGKLEDILERALDALLAKIDPVQKPIRSSAAPKNEASVHSRYIPKPVQRAVWQRDGGQCTHTASDGQRCSERHFLEIDHRVPFSIGGSSRDSENLRLLCRAHNQLYARRTFGEAFMAKRSIPRGILRQGLASSESLRRSQKVIPSYSPR